MSATLILVIVLLYFGVLFLISYFTSRDASNESFFVANRKAPWYLVAFGMIGTSISGVTFISIPGVVGNLADTNAQFSYMQMAMGYLVGYAFIALVLMPLYYRLNLQSIYKYLDKRFGFWTYKTGATFFLISRTIGSAFRLYLAALALQVFIFDALGIHFALNVLFCLILIWTYTWRAGVKTLIWTDSLQSVFLVASVVLSIIYIAHSLGLSLFELPTYINNSPYSQWFFFDDPNAKRYFWKQFLGGAFIAITMTGLDQDLMQKNISCKNIGEAQKNMFSFAAVSFLINLCFVSLGALLYLYAAHNNIALPAATDQVFPTLALQYFPQFMGIIFLLGIIASTYASSDSALTALTTSFCIDILDFDKRRNTSSEMQLRRLRTYVHIGFCILMFGVVLLFKYVLSKAVVTALFKVATYTYGPLLGLYAFGLYVPRRTLRDHLVPFICVLPPFICWAIDSNSVQWFNGYNFGLELIILNGLITFIGLWAISVPKPKTTLDSTLV